MRATPVQTSFASGEISPRVLSRVDLDAYYTGAAKLDNFICLPHGPLLRRQGSTFISEAASNDVRLIPFMFNVEQSFVLELSEKSVRFYYQGGLITKSDGSPFTVTTPWTASQIKDINWAQSGDVLYIVHQNVPPQKLSRLANDNWTIAPVTFKDQPENWKDTNWPSCVVFFEQRLYYAATPSKPQTIWGSRVGLFDEFTLKDSAGEVVDDMGFEYTIASDDVNGIKWLKAVDVLAAGTSGAEYKISSTTLNEPVTPKNIRISRQTSYGSAPVRPQQIGAGIVFVQRSKNRLRLFEYLWTDNQYGATDITVLSEHIANAGVRAMALQTAKDTYVWCALEDGSLIGLTYEKQQKVIAWHAHHLGGNGKVKSIAIIPGPKADQVYMAVERVLNGKTVTYIEAFLDAFSEVDEPKDCRFVDCSLTYTSDTPTNALQGLQHLEGQEVSILVDGWVHPNLTVTNGSIKLQQSGKVIHVGLPYTSTLESVPIHASEFVTLGRKKRIYAVDISFLLSLGFDFGVTDGPWQTKYMGPTRVMNRAQDLFTGTIQCSIPSSTANESQVKVRQTLPLPCIIRAIKYHMDVN